jgi:hypothetical protein
MTHLEALRNLPDQQPEHHMVDKLRPSLVGDLAVARLSLPVGATGFQPWQGILESEGLVRAQLEAGQGLQIQLGSRLRIRHRIACDHMGESIEDPELAQIRQNGLAP